jgi:hypothetical protein
MGACAGRRARPRAYAWRRPAPPTQPPPAPRRRRALRLRPATGPMLSGGGGGDGEARERAAPQTVVLGNRTWALPGPQIHEMVDSTPLLRAGDGDDGAVALLRERLATDGYCLLRSVLPRQVVDAGCQRIAEEMARGGWFAEGTAPADRIRRPGGPVAGFDGPNNGQFSKVFDHRLLAE